MRPNWVSNPGPLTYKSDALSTALCRPATDLVILVITERGKSLSYSRINMVMLEKDQVKVYGYTAWFPAIFTTGNNFGNSSHHGFSPIFT